MELHELLKFTSITARMNATLDWLEKVHAHERPLQIVAFSNVFASTIGALLSILGRVRALVAGFSENTLKICNPDD